MQEKEKMAKEQQWHLKQWKHQNQLDCAWIFIQSHSAGD